MPLVYLDIFKGQEAKIILGVGFKQLRVEYQEDGGGASALNRI